jgi:hypothetical protein
MRYRPDLENIEDVLDRCEPTWARDEQRDMIDDDKIRAAWEEYAGPFAGGDGIHPYSRGYRDGYAAAMREIAERAVAGGYQPIDDCSQPVAPGEK